MDLWEEFFFVAIRLALEGLAPRGTGFLWWGWCAVSQHVLGHNAICSTPTHRNATRCCSTLWWHVVVRFSIYLCYCAAWEPNLYCCIIGRWWGNGSASTWRKNAAPRNCRKHFESVCKILLKHLEFARVFLTWRVEGPAFYNYYFFIPFLEIPSRQPH